VVGTATLNATAIPNSENAVRREIISDFIFSIMSNLLLFHQKMGTLRAMPPAARSPSTAAAQISSLAMHHKRLRRHPHQPPQL
jgi:hypothetical protein